MSTVAIELVIGRQLTASEEAIDVVRLDRALAKAKDDLNAAIADEMLRATLIWITNGGSPRLSVTPDMRLVLDELYMIGVEEGWLELERLGYDLQGRRQYIEEGPDSPADVPDYLSRNLRGIEIRIEDELVRPDLSGMASSAVARAVMQLPGARDLASRAISTAMIGGFASTFEQVEDLVGEWQYTAILDGGTCDVCRPLDGTVYATLEQLFRVLPNYGPNPRCYGGGRCRCRAVPMPATPEAEPLPPEPVELDGEITPGTKVQAQGGHRLVGDKYEPTTDVIVGKVHKVEGDIVYLNAGTAKNPAWAVVERAAVRAVETPAKVATDGPLKGSAIKKALDQTRDLHTAESRAALKAYTGDGYGTINGALRKSKGKSASADVKALDELFARTAPLDEEAIVYRSVDYTNTKVKIAIDETITDHAFVSTSMSKAAAERHGLKTADFVEIVLPKGTRALDVNALQKSEYGTERELLLPRGSRFKIVSVKPLPGGRKGTRLIRAILIV